MLECNRVVRKKMTTLARVFVLLLPVVCIVLLLTQTAFAKNTFLINDGGRVMIHTTYATDPAAVLNEAGLSLGEEDTFTTQSGIGMSEITVQRKQCIQIVYSGKTLEVTSYGETVEDLLKKQNFTLTEDDVVSVSLNTQTYDGMTITISHTDTVEEAYTTAIPYNTTYCYDSTIPNGEQIILTPGKEGQMSCVASVFYVNGMEINRTVLSQTVLMSPVDELVAIGTYIEPTEEATIPTEPPVTQPPVMQPSQAPVETGRPVIGDGTITLSSGEVLHFNSVMQMVATAYTHTDPGCNMITATGTTVRIGTVAVDPRVIPYGTQMFIVANDGSYVYGVATAEDCGGSIKNNRIDLYYPTHNECIQFGIRECTVYFLG